MLQPLNLFVEGSLDLLLVDDLVIIQLLHGLLLTEHAFMVLVGDVILGVALGVLSGLMRQTGGDVLA